MKNITPIIKNKFMKTHNKIFLIITSCLALILISQINVSYATSGACSYHGGVNCSAGASDDGNAICNDGFISSTSYYYTNECNAGDMCSSEYSSQQLNTYQNYTEVQRIIIKKNIDQKIDSINKQINDLQNHANTTISQYTSDVNSRANVLVQQFQQQKQGALGMSLSAAAKADPYAMAQDQTQRIAAVSSPYDSKISQVQNNTNNSIALNTATINSILVSSITPLRSCVRSLAALKLDLAALDDFCTMTYGKNSILGTGSSKCDCVSGYEFNEPKTSCVEIPKCPENSIDSKGVCVAKFGFILKNEKYISYTENCRSTYGDHSLGSLDGTSCNCDSGYKWNTNQTSCIKIEKAKEVQTNSDLTVKLPQVVQNNSSVVASSSSTNIQSVVPSKPLGGWWSRTLDALKYWNPFYQFIK